MSLKSIALDNPTIGCGKGFLYGLHVEQCVTTLFISISSETDVPIHLNKFSRLLADGCLNFCGD